MHSRSDAVGMLFAGCSQQAAATDDLIHALSESHSAIASSLLAIQLYEQQRSTRAATETLLGDMAGQIADAQRALEPITIDSPQLQSDRNAVSDAIHAGATSLLSSRDELERSGAVDSTAGSVPASGGALGTIGLPNASVPITPSCSPWFSRTLPTVSRARLSRSIGGRKDPRRRGWLATPSLTRWCPASSVR
jgi:hypothetical protein